ncbi:alpha/beta fold hydrolase [Parapedobacter sp. DT-150]|uniref:alpha/beta fold hydrolase n=1 Tax=Parapedobacter sp. DT-150 TaxID=3396162 RepID=UPI003F1C6C06
MNYRLFGDPARPAVLLLHAIGTSGSMWARIVDRLKDRYCCIVVDLPGHGQSRAIPWSTLDRVAADLADLVQGITGGRRVHVAGLSFGAYVGLVMLRRRPHVVESAFLSGLNVLPFPNKGAMRIMGRLIGRLVKTGLLIRMNARILRIPEVDFPAYRDSVRQLDRRAFVRANAEVLEFTLPAAAGGYTPRALFLTGENEHSLILRSLEQLTGAVDGSSARLVKGLGHGWSAEAPDLFASALAGWIEGHEPDPDHFLIPPSA